MRFFCSSGEPGKAATSLRIAAKRLRSYRFRILLRSNRLLVPSYKPKSLRLIGLLANWLAIWIASSLSSCLSSKRPISVATWSISEISLVKNCANLCAGKRQFGFVFSLGLMIEMSELLMSSKRFCDGASAPPNSCSILFCNTSAIKAWFSRIRSSRAARSPKADFSEWRIWAFLPA